MQFNKSVVYQGKEKENTWGDFEHWADIERSFDGRWAKVTFLSAFVELPYSFANLIGKKFVSQFELLYPKQNFRQKVLYRLYGKVEKSWMFVSNLILVFSEFVSFRVNFLSSLFSDLKVRFKFLSSLGQPFSVLRFNFVSSLYEVFEVVKIRFLSSLGLRVLSKFNFVSSLRQSFLGLKLNFALSSGQSFLGLKFNFVSSLGQSFLSKFNFVPSCREDSKKFGLFITPIVDKDVWGSFGVWQDTYIAKNDTWGG